MELALGLTKLSTTDMYVCTRFRACLSFLVGRRLISPSPPLFPYSSPPAEA